MQLFTFITKSLNKLYIGLFVAKSSNSLDIDNFLECILNLFFLKFRQFWPKYLGTMEKFMFLSQIITRTIIPPLPHSMLKKLAGNTSCSIVNTFCYIEMGESGEIKVIFQFSLAKLICSNIFGQDCSSLIFCSLM